MPNQRFRVINLLLIDITAYKHHRNVMLATGSALAVYQIERQEWMVGRSEGAVSGIGKHISFAIVKNRLV